MKAEKYHSIKQNINIIIGTLGNIIKKIKDKNE